MHTPDWIRQIKTPKINHKHHTIPIYAPFITPAEKAYVNTCMEDTWLSSKGLFVQQFETAFAKYCGSPYAVSCSSGTSALFLALKLMGIKKGDEVIVPTFTMISTAFAVTYTGATPVFIDCLPESGNIDPDSIERLITKKTKAIIPVHVYGTPCDMASITQIATKHHVQILEDAAEALGATYRDKHIGGVSDFNAFSLYVNKIVTTGEGGMVTLKSKRLYDKLKYLNNYSFSSKRHFWHKTIGYNYRLSNIQAAIGVGQIEHIEETLSKKRAVAALYDTYMQPIRDSIIPYAPNKNGAGNHWHIAYRTLDPHIDIMKLRNHLADNGIETRSAFLPLHLQPAYRKNIYEGKFPHSEKLARTSFLLPSGPTLTESEIAFVCQLVRDFIKR